MGKLNEYSHGQLWLEGGEAETTSKGLANLCKVLSRGQLAVDGMAGGTSGSHSWGSIFQRNFTMLGKRAKWFGRIVTGQTETAGTMKLGRVTLRSIQRGCVTQLTSDN